MSLDPKTNTLAVTGGEDDKAFVWRVSDGELLFECSGEVLEAVRVSPPSRASPDRLFPSRSSAGAGLLAVLHSLARAVSVTQHL